MPRPCTDITCCCKLRGYDMEADPVPVLIAVQVRQIEVRYVLLFEDAA